MTCTFYYEKKQECVNAYCYYPKNPEIDCPRKKSFIEEKGIVYRESPTDKPLINSTQPRKYPKQY